VHARSTQASRTVFRRGLILVSLFYICWSVMLTNGVLTSFMIQVSGKQHRWSWCWG
jgi:hypothetical protein